MKYNTYINAKVKYSNKHTFSKGLFKNRKPFIEFVICIEHNLWPSLLCFCKINNWIDFFHCEKEVISSLLKAGVPRFMIVIASFFHLVHLTKPSEQNFSSTKTVYFIRILSKAIFWIYLLYVLWESTKKFDADGDAHFVFTPEPALRDYQNVSTKTSAKWISSKFFFSRNCWNWLVRYSENFWISLRLS